jgi:hypothetical protein
MLKSCFCSEAVAAEHRTFSVTRPGTASDMSAVLRYKTQLRSYTAGTYETNNSLNCAGEFQPVR